MSVILRAITSKLTDLMQQYPAVAITGPRQSGKTTLARHTFPDMQYVSLEDPDTRIFAEEDPRGFLAACDNGAIIDEIQRVPHLFSYLQTMIDSSNEPGRYILSGSQNFLLMENISQTLAGRIALLNLLPLSLSELIHANKNFKSLEKTLFSGFYPRIYNNRVSANDWYNNYIQTYIEKDVRQIKNITDLTTFQRFLKMCAARCGQLVNFSALANDCGIAHNTAKSWLSLLESSFIIYFLQPYHNNFNKRLVKSPKLYFYDTGLACALLGITEEQQLTHHYLRGGLFESFIISDLYKNEFNAGRRSQFYFWQDKLGREIDCLIETQRLMAIEIKSGKTIADDFFNNFSYLQQQTVLDRNNCYLIYGGDNNQQRQKANVLSWRSVTDLLKK